jgi:hypothetical protein
VGGASAGKVSKGGGVNKHYELKQQVEAEIEAACKPIREAIWKKHCAALAQAKEEDRVAEEAWRDRATKSALKKALWPPGTKLVEWTNQRTTWKYGPVQKIPWEQTGQVGFFEIYDERTSGKVIPMKSHGIQFVRLARKDGSPGSKSASWFRWECWLPEGEHPDTYAHPANVREEIAL